MREAWEEFCEVLPMMLLGLGFGAVVFLTVLLLTLPFIWLWG